MIGGDDLPTKKPDPGPLRHAAAVFGIPPRLLLMVGDSGNDVEAARAPAARCWSCRTATAKGGPCTSSTPMV